MRIPRKHPQRGFAIVLTVTLLALLVIIALAISMTARLDSELSSATRSQLVAKQNALTGLQLALGSLQEAAGPEARLTGMAGLVGIGPSISSPTRYWTGVWNTDGSFIRWLVSGNSTPSSPGTNLLRLVGEGTIGVESQTSATREKEHVQVPLVSISGTQGAVGHYAYWIGDEGIKISAFVPVSETPTSGQLPTVTSSLSTQMGTWNTAQSMSEEELERIISYEQLEVAGASAAQRKESFHYLTLQARHPTGAGYLSGRVNLNTASRPFWISLTATYNLRNPGNPLTQYVSVGRQIADAMTNGPFATVTDFQNGRLLDDALPSMVTPAVFVQTLQDLLTTRSDTFRIRAYGDAINPADSAIAGSTPEAVAYCEAIVQRTNEDDPLGNGKKFVITYFRWLGPDDI